MDLISSADSWPPLLQPTYPRDPANPPSAAAYTIPPAPTHPWGGISQFPECVHMFMCSHCPRVNVLWSLKASHLPWDI